MAGRRRLSREEEAAYRDIISGSERIQERVRRAAQHTNDPDVLRELEDIQSTSESMIVRLVGLLLGLFGLAVVLIYLL